MRSRIGATEPTAAALAILAYANTRWQLGIPPEVWTAGIFLVVYFLRRRFERLDATGKALQRV